MNAQSLFRKRSRGQALIVIIAAFMGMLLFMGLMLDLGQLFLAKAYLRRTADAASLAAAGQYREGRTEADLIAAAREVSHLNNIDPDIIEVHTCDNTPGDPELCILSGGIPRKLVRVMIGMRYPLTFLALINIKFVDLTEASTSEAASLDLVLVLDVSESMTWDAVPPAKYDAATGVVTSGNPLRDPSECNLDNSCKPFDSVKANAKEFVKQILQFDSSLGEDTTLEQDRVAIVTFANGWQGGTLGTYTAPIGVNGWTRDRWDSLDYIDGLKVYDPGQTCENYFNMDEAGTPIIDKVYPCRNYFDGYSRDPTKYNDLLCWQFDEDLPMGPNALSACGTTNFGGGLYLAASQFGRDKRLEALWVVVTLTDGAANATFSNDADLGTLTGPFVFPPIGEDKIADNLPFGFCPGGTYWTSNESGDWSIPNSPHRMWCQDEDAESFHGPATVANYDAADFAHDQANYVACAGRTPAAGCNGTQGLGAVIFSIGLGPSIMALDYDQTAPYGGYLLRYVAAVGDDGDPDTDPCDGVSDYTENCGNYFYSESGSGLTDVFDAIASRIFTRLTK